MPNCRTGTYFEKSSLFYVSRRNTRQRHPIDNTDDTSYYSTCCYRIPLSCISSANVIKEVTFRNLFLCCNFEFTLCVLLTDVTVYWNNVFKRHFRYYFAPCKLIGVRALTQFATGINWVIHLILRYIVKRSTRSTYLPRRKVGRAIGTSFLFQFTPFHIHSFLIVFFCFFVLFNSCCWNALVQGSTL